jgi:hypothetical protein
MVTVDVENPPDTRLPTISIGGAVDGSTVTKTKQITLVADYAVPLSSVQFFINGTMQASVLSRPFGYAWNTLLWPNGTYTLTGQAVTLAGFTAVTSPVTVTVVNGVDVSSPSISVPTPLMGATVAGTTPLVVVATDNVVVARVDFYLDETLLASATSYPYTFAWDTTQTADGAHSVMAAAFDPTGNRRSSPTLKLNVANTADSTPPAVAIASPTAGTPIYGKVAVAVEASDDVGRGRGENRPGRQFTNTRGGFVDRQRMRHLTRDRDVKLLQHLDARAAAACCP